MSLMSGNSDGCVITLYAPMPVPVIARVQGAAAGGGCDLFLGCDLVSASSSVPFAEPLAPVGLSVDFGGSWLLPRLVGLYRVKEICLFGGRGAAVPRPRQPRRRTDGDRRCDVGAGRSTRGRTPQRARPHQTAAERVGGTDLCRIP